MTIPVATPIAKVSANSFVQKTLSRSQTSLRVR
jgi:hypothetical protein